MSIGIGIVAVFTGLFCTSPEAAVDTITSDIVHADCLTIEDPIQLMPQAVIAKNKHYKVVRMGTITDPVKNIWMILPADVPVMGEAK